MKEKGLLFDQIYPGELVDDPKDYKEFVDFNPKDIPTDMDVLSSLEELDVEGY